MEGVGFLLDLSKRFFFSGLKFLFGWGRRRKSNTRRV